MTLLTKKFLSKIAKNIMIEAAGACCLMMVLALKMFFILSGKDIRLRDFPTYILGVSQNQA